MNTNCQKQIYTSTFSISLTIPTVCYPMFLRPRMYSSIAIRFLGKAVIRYIYPPRYWIPSCEPLSVQAGISTVSQSWFVRS